MKKPFCLSFLLIVFMSLAVNAGQTFGQWAVSTNLPLDATVADCMFGGNIDSLDGVNQYTNLNTIYLGFNGISNIEQGDFTGLSNLEKLFLHNNGLNSIEKDDFTGLINLQQLDLEYNQLTSIKKDDFEKLPNLLWLGLGINPLSSIESGTFAGASNLRFLDLRYNFSLSVLNLQNANFQQLDGFSIFASATDRVELNGATLSQLAFNTLMTGGDGHAEYGISGVPKFDTSHLGEHDLAEFPTVEEVDLSFAHLAAVGDWSELGKTESLETLVLTGVDFHPDVAADNFQELVDLISDLEDHSLDYLTIDSKTYLGNQDAFDAWDGIGGNVLTVSTAAVPEPSSILLLCLGVFGLLGMRRRNSLQRIESDCG